MACWRIELPDSVADRFDKVAASRGGRVALLCRIVTQTSELAAHRQEPAAEGNFHFNVRITHADRRELDFIAAPLGMTANAWAAGLIRSRMRQRPTFARADENRLIAIQTELRRIRVSLNQMGKAAHAAALAGHSLELDPHFFVELRDELSAQLLGLRAALAGNLEYWEGQL